MRRHVAIDLGASGGRVAVGTFDGDSLQVEVVHRFPNGPVERDGDIYWPIEELWDEIQVGLRAASKLGVIDSLGVDSWAVDYGLIDEHGTLLDGVHHYRSSRTEAVLNWVFERSGRARMFDATGIQFQPFNTYFQLLADQTQNLKIFRKARRFLMVPDLLHFWLTGIQSNERTNASTTAMMDARSGGTCPKTLNDNDLLLELSDVREPGTLLGPITEEIRTRTGLNPCNVVLPATHDTASAVAAVPAEGKGWAYISSGTWSLVGVELAQPNLSMAAYEGNFTNEAGVNGTTRFLKNMMGLWILQECRHAWGDPAFDQLYTEAAEIEDAPTFDPDDPRFLTVGGDMPQRVEAMIAVERGVHSATPMADFSPPEEPHGLLTRSILNSLATKTARIIEEIESITGQKIDRIHIVGGGSQIELLNQLIADRSGRTVIAGPVEATLLGNILVQAEAWGTIAKGSIREVVRAHFETKSYFPNQPPARS